MRKKREYGTIKKSFSHRIQWVILMKKFRVHIFSLTQCLFVFGLFFFVLVLLFSANLAVQYASANIKTNVLPCVIIDAGHGGEDGGAQTADGVLEKEINLSIAKRLQTLLSALGFETKMTRTDDSLRYDASCKTMREKKVSDIRARFSMMEQTPNAVFLSIHQNHYSEPKYAGAQVFYSANTAESPVLAEAIQRSIVKTLQPENERVIKPCGDEVYLLYHANKTAVMVECGFLSNPQEAAKLEDENYQTALSLCIVQGLLDYFNHRT